MLRSFAAPLLLLIAVVFETCTVPIPWAVNPDSSPLPEATLPAAWVSAGTLIEDSILERADIPAYMDLIFDPDPKAHFLQPSDGSTPYVTLESTWSGGINNVYRIRDSRTAYQLGQEAAQTGADRDEGFASQYEEVTDFDAVARAFQDPPDPRVKTEQRTRTVIATRVVDRVRVELVISFDDDDPAWLEQSKSLFALAVQRTEEALAAAGD